MSYFFPINNLSPEKLEEIKRHFEQMGYHYQTFEIAHPYKAIGFSVGNEYARHNAEFRRIIGLEDDPDALNFERLKETDIGAIFLVEIDRPHDDKVQETTYHATYEGNVKAIGSVLQKMAQDQQVNIRGISKGRCAKFFYGECTRCQDEYARPNEIVVSFKCGRRRLVQNSPDFNKIYDHRLGTSGQSIHIASLRLLPSSSMVIADSQGLEVAEVIDGCVYILVNLEASEYSYVTGKASFWTHAGVVLERILSEAIPIAKDQNGLGSDTTIPWYIRHLAKQHKDLSQRKENGARLYSDEQEALVTRKIAQINEQVEVISRDSNTHLQRFMSGQQALVELGREHARLLSIDTTAQALKKREEFTKVTNTEGIIGATYDAREGLCIYTDCIYIEHEDKTYFMGAYKIVFNENSVRIRNLITTPNPKWDHPHIVDGVFLFSEVAESIAQMLKDEEIEMLVILILQLLHTYNPETARCKIELWQVAQELYRAGAID